MEVGRASYYAWPNSIDTEQLDTESNQSRFWLPSDTPFTYKVEWFCLRKPKQGLQNIQPIYMHAAVYEAWDLLGAFMCSFWYCKVVQNVQWVMIGLTAPQRPNIHLTVALYHPLVL